MVDFLVGSIVQNHKGRVALCPGALTYCWDFASAHKWADRRRAPFIWFAQSAGGWHWSIRFYFQAYFALSSQIHPHTCSCMHGTRRKLSVVYYMPSCEYKIVAFRLHVLSGTLISGTSAIYIYIHSKLFCNNVCCSSLDACMTQPSQPGFQWASTPGTLMSSLHSEMLQHLHSKRAVAACCLLPLRLATK